MGKQKDSDMDYSVNVLGSGNDGIHPEDEDEIHLKCVAANIYLKRLFA